jgi:hypothetical protein
LAAILKIDQENIQFTGPNDPDHPIRSVPQLSAHWRNQCLIHRPVSSFTPSDIPAMSVLELGTD